MGKKDKYAEEFEKLQREIVPDRVQAVFDRQPALYRQGLEEVGFAWFDDDMPSEEEEEQADFPVSANQQLLVNYFEGALPPTTGRRR